jgi:DNA-binding NarL/FixJ family response regulator
MNIRVLIADDHKVVADGLRLLLEAQSDIDVVDSVRSGRDAIRRAAELHPEVILMDSDMPDLNGIEATRLIRERLPEVRILMLSVHSSAMHIVRALRAGAAGYVPKNSAGSDVVDAIRTVHGGRRYIHRSIAEEVLAQLV